MKRVGAAEKARKAQLLDLRRQVAALESGGKAISVLPFGPPAIDAGLPWGGLPLAALHEIGGAGGDREDGAVAAAFLAGILARLAPKRPVLWCLKHADLHAPGLALFGLAAERLLLLRAPNEQKMLWAMEEGLRSRALAAVIGEAEALPPPASRRLQLAAECSGTAAFVLHRHAEIEITPPSAAVTRWRVAALPGSLAGEPGVGRPLWRVELLRCRGGLPAAWDVEACDAAGHVAFPAALADRPARQRRAAG